VANWPDVPKAVVPVTNTVDPSGLSVTASEKAGAP
jgi:hypothetical protein